MRIGSLFSGIGGLELGLERAGLGHTVWQVEKEAARRRGLIARWPEAKQYEDVRTFPPLSVDHRLINVDLICGGPPCQPFSTASRGRRVAIDLFPEFIRIVTKLRPRFVVAENVARDPIEGAADALAEEGYATTTIELSAAVVGAPHERPRWWLVADANGKSKSRRAINAEVAGLSAMANPHWRHYPSPRLGMDDGATGRVDRLRALGNAVVPQCAEVIGHVIRQLM